MLGLWPIPVGLGIAAVLVFIAATIAKWRDYGFSERTLRRWDRRGRIPRWARWIRPQLHFCCELDGALIDEKPEFCSCVPE